MRTTQTGFQSRHGEQRLHQRRVERCAQGDGLGKTGSIGSRVTVKALFVEHDWNAQAAVLEEELLDCVRELGHAACLLATTSIAGAADLTQSAAIAKRLLSLLEIEVAGIIQHGLGLGLPDAHHLCGLFFQRHPRKQVLDAPGRGETGVLVSGSGFAGGHGDCGLLLFHAIHSFAFLTATMRGD